MKSAILLSILILSCTPKTRIISPLETYGMLNNEFAVLIDLRKKTEITAQRSKQFTVETILRDEEKWHNYLNSVPSNKTFIFFGTNSKMIATHLSMKGRKSGYFLTFKDWTKEKLPTMKSR